MDMNAFVVTLLWPPETDSRVGSIERQGSRIYGTLIEIHTCTELQNSYLSEQFEE
jgi:hypothetical protein